MGVSPRSERLEQILPLRPAVDTPPAPDPDALLIKVLRHENTEEAAEAEKPLVLVLASLDEDRVRRFATGKGTPNVDGFLAEIDALNLWQFARRPLDLDWLVQFWQRYQRLGSLSEMLATSLRARSKESDPSRARRHLIDPDRALAALERVGAALVFGRAVTITIPDDEITLSGDSNALDLDDILPDWPAEDRVRLFNLPVFDPATFGRVRLHNDNKGVVRAYLAARWLLRLHKSNLSRHRLFDLLFSDTYGQRLVKPSMQETAAWLSLWVPDVAREVIQREPYLLLTAGDPGSLSTEVRGSMLTQLIERLVANDERVPFLDFDSVKRFAKPDMGPVIRQLWPIHKGHKEARNLLLRIVWLGAITECEDVTVEALATTPRDRFDRVVAGRAFVAVTDPAGKRDYVAQVVRDSSSLPLTVVWDAVEELFPDVLSVDDLLTILGKVDVADTDGGVGFKWKAPDLVRRVHSVPQLEKLLAGLVAIAGDEPADIAARTDERGEAFLAAIAATAHQLASKAPDDSVPVVAVDAAFRVGRYSRFGGHTSWEKVGDVGAELRRTAQRRRAAFWRAADKLSGHRFLHGRAIQAPWELEVLGWSPALTNEDLDWLLRDTPLRSADNERRLGINAAMEIWVRPDGRTKRFSAFKRSPPAILQ